MLFQIKQKMGSQLLVLLLSIGVFSPAANAHLAAVGPVSSVNGFPVWYKDVDGLTLELCLVDANNCLLPSIALFATVQFSGKLSR